MSFFVDIHALQTLPPSNINRDDTGSPKSAIFGGVSRQRVSSQAWKSVIRRNFEEHLDRSEIGVRTRQVADMIVDRITNISPDFDPDKAESAVVDAFKAAKIKLEKPKAKKGEENTGRAVSGYLLFLSNQQINRLANAIIEAPLRKSKTFWIPSIVLILHSLAVCWPTPQTSTWMPLARWLTPLGYMVRNLILTTTLPSTT